MYEKFYRLSGSPFRLTPDHRFFFQSAGHKKALSYLQYGLQQGEGFIVITGNVGTGKSTLVSQLFAQLDTKQIVAAQINTTQIGADDAIRMILSAFNLSVQTGDKATILRALEAFLVQQNKQRKRVLLVVDEAQNLPLESLEELRMLSNFVSDGHPLFQCYLIGQPQFDVKLANPQLEQLRQRVIASYLLEPMLPFETQDYIEHRLHRVGWTGRPMITADAYHRIYAETEGVPRRINSLCNRVLLCGCIEQLETIDGEVVDDVVVDHRKELAEAVRVGRANLAASETRRPRRAGRKTVDNGILEERLQGIERTLQQHNRAIWTLLDSVTTVLASMKNGDEPAEDENVGQNGADR